MPGDRNTLQLAAHYGNLDIFRTLLREGACADHVDINGWTVAFHLWTHQAIQRQNRTQFLKMIHLDGCCDLTAIGPGNWTALHKAAATGKAEDVSTLIRYGADPGLCTQDMNWNPLHYAALVGNNETIAELVQSQAAIDINALDVRGWSPLHIAAYFGSFSTLTKLLELGACSQIRSHRTDFLVPEDVAGRRVTPEQVAKSRGEQQHRIYLEALQESIAERSIQEDQTFWDARESP